MKQILVVGAGKSSTVLINYLIATAEKEQWHIHVADRDMDLARSKTGNSNFATGHQLNDKDEDVLQKLVKSSDLVISMLPPSLHYRIAEMCLAAGKHYLNASYATEEMQKLGSGAAAKGLVFLLEMGLDPGMDHMSAMKLIHKIQSEGGKIQSFRSHCGGLVAPESDDNPWHYKISWNPRNIVLAGKDGAVYLEKGKIRKTPYEELFDPERKVEVPGIGTFAWYPNRDSLPYIQKYSLEEAGTFIRTTLRHPDFCLGWKNLIDLKLTDETPQYDTTEMNLASFFQIHFDRYGFSDWLQHTLSLRFNRTKELLESLLKLMEAEKKAAPEERMEMQEFLAIDEKGELQDMNLDKIKKNTTSSMAYQMYEANTSLKQLLYLGLDSSEEINRGLCSAADVIQFIMEKKLALKPHDKDRIIMLHEIDYQMGRKKKSIQSLLFVDGDDQLHTAMAKTVGLPLGIAAKLILEGRIQKPGVRIPVDPEIYLPVLEELSNENIQFREMES